MKHLVRKYFSSNLKNTIRGFLAKIDLMVLPLFTKSPFLSSVYYLLFSGEFRREHHAVLNGRVAYYKNLKLIAHSSVLLRRNTHRLEKGLIMQPRRDIFAKDYILETVKNYVLCSNQPHFNQKELKWANNVLCSYFECVTKEESIKLAYELFIRTHSTASEYLNSATPSLPYLEADRAISYITAKELNALYLKRRSVRWFENTPVERHKIEQAIDMALLAPSACNRQPFDFRLSNGLDKAPEIAKLAMGTKGFAQNIPAIIVIVGDLSAYPSERDKHGIYVDGGLVAMQLMLALETLGLSSCPINWPDIDNYEDKMKERLNLTDYERPVMLMAIGYADEKGKIPYSDKKEHIQLLKDIT
jgi:nitroreductase